MKYSALFILSFFLFVNACAQQKSQQSSALEDVVYTEQDAEIFADIISKFKDQSDKPIQTLIPEIGKYFLGQEYVAHTLEEGDSEKLIINLREQDCTTYAENLFALARTLKSENQNLEQFAKELEQIRYRNGKLEDYPSRLHYFSEWVYDKTDRNLVETPADTFGEPWNLDLNFMSTHTDSYKHLKANPDYVSVITAQEREISNKTYSFIPKEKIGDVDHLLREGDIIGLTTSIAGLDVAHVGVLVEVEGKLHLLHASQSSYKVEVSDEPIASFLKPNSKNTGIIVARPIN